ncbi:MAG: hypothetical protein JSS72_11840 [Armatimonadetes bacterium]|nr:hypothetical protein [Armatimonadota bacterium]
MDSRARVMVGPKFREALGNDFTITLSELGCVTIFPKAAWEAFTERIWEKDDFSTSRELLERHFIGYAEEEQNLDSQGRLVIPKALRDKAQLSGEVLQIGHSGRLHLWNPDEYDKYELAMDSYGGERRLRLEQARIRVFGEEAQ